MTQAIERPSQLVEDDYQTGTLSPANTDTEIGIPLGDVPALTAELPSVPVPDIYERHDLAREGEDTPARSLPLTSYDAIVASYALQNSKAVEWAELMHGPEHLQSALDKARAVADINIANSHSSAASATKLYNRLAKGAIPDDSYLPLYRTIENIEPFIEAPVHEIGENPLGFTANEANVVWDALRVSALYPTRKGEDTASMDLLSRFAPSHSERAYYGALLEQAGVHLDTGKRLPVYPVRVEADR